MHFKNLLILILTLMSLNSVSAAIPKLEPGMGKTLEHIVGYSEIVAMGESMHNLSEPTLYRIPIFKYLVENKGFTIMVGETGVLRARKIDAFIKAPIPSHWSAADYERELERVTDEGLTHFMGEYQEMVEIVRYMHQYNLAHPKNQLSFVGIDLPKYGDNLYKMLHELESELSFLSPTQIARVSSYFVELKRLTKVQHFFYSLLEKASGGKVDPDYLDDITSFGWEILTKKEQVKVKNQKKLLFSELKQMKLSSGQLETVELFETLYGQLIRDLEVRDFYQVQPLRNYFKKALMAKTGTSNIKDLGIVLDQKVDGDRALLIENVFVKRNDMDSSRIGRDLSSPTGYDPDWTKYFQARYESREHHLIDNLRSHMKGGAKLFFFAHNGHVQKTPIDDTKGGGTILADVEGDNYKVIGVTNDQFMKDGKVLTDLFGMPVEESSTQPDSFEWIVSQQTSDVVLIETDQPWLDQERPFRWNTGFKPVNVAESFDGVLYFPHAQMGIKVK